MALFFFYPGGSGADAGQMVRALLSRDKSAEARRRYGAPHHTTAAPPRPSLMGVGGGSLL
jgi:hypothetical protein